MAFKAEEFLEFGFHRIKFTHVTNKTYVALDVFKVTFYFVPW